jgi:predicted RNase H-like HicB family nuclease
MVAMTSNKTYVAVYSRDPVDDAWNVRIKGVAGCQTYGRSIRQAHARIREALAVWLDCEPEDLEVRDEFPPNVREVASRAVKAREAAQRAGEKAQAEAAEAARALTELGISRRDAGELLGLSHQRVQQLVDAG